MVKYTLILRNSQKRTNAALLIVANVSLEEFREKVMFGLIPSRHRGWSQAWKAEVRGAYAGYRREERGWDPPAVYKYGRKGMMD